MNLLAFDTSTEALSIAVAHGDAPVLEYLGRGGANASAALIPQAMTLLGRAGLTLRELDAVVFGCGPGSFTGLRTACSVAQGLALGAGVPVLPVETLMAVAEDARRLMGATDVLALLDARMDEVYAARYRHDGRLWRRDGDIALTAPQALQLPPDSLLAGNVFAAYGSRIPMEGRQAVVTTPLAAALLRLAPGLLADGEGRPAEQALPLYVRDKVAQTTAEREAVRAAAAAQARMSP
ncbi:tRNA (adenosine(37)-N6)-threonylcarbamoyltransferase complex dimerization subunit type 1 TsaB [Ramlibacter henchirensis]|uniref:tRNA (Adenosine(37)-N6)-threonylcarbamoyltransferase complex dimerization subunit type 1 TsaB n=1 Tax=Ramlibacter henchirensis TaxID=204072 RepID=A0A4Z0C9U1_9BURK|nr:tRNA (adenosine(37)-N6)-threonylcarbamoyltransferase complex dimerization subunit type 1 TsaB [Ramlibacter henchirensis]TFZ06885.1 tRNA (adenosine(37)-N6)-threonylcarbamoyltransferase complex dimerization subunit type 1 TsaB [Ramlibacter henchirensis]